MGRGMERTSMICETGQFPLAETCNARGNFSKSFKRDGEIDSREKIDERLKERSWRRDAIDETKDEDEEEEDAAHGILSQRGGSAHLKIPRNGLRKLFEFAEYKSFPMAVIRFSRVFESTAEMHLLFVLLLRESGEITSCPLPQPLVAKSQ